MKKYLLFILIYGLSSALVSAREVGIEFETMKVGTKLTIKTLGYVESTLIEEYIGEQDGYYQTQTYELLDGGTTKTLNKASYDENGRLVSSVLDGKTNTYTPYSCEYVVGECAHTYKYYNWATKKYVINERSFSNRLDGDTLYVGVIKFDGEMFERPYVLGPHRLRVSNEAKDALGTITGHKFVDLIVPD